LSGKSGVPERGSRVLPHSLKVQSVTAPRLLIRHYGAIRREARFLHQLKIQTNGNGPIIIFPLRLMS